jgi:cytidine deaminase
MMKLNQMTSWNPEDEKLAVLAKGARSRVQAKIGAALRDETGRTYASAEVSIGSLVLSAVEMVVAQAVASGSTGVESVVISSQFEVSATDSEIELVRALAGTGVPLYVVDETGKPIDSRLT